ncbi:MAG: hypothetical protein OXE73_08870 [Gammaproteobacteria bacterium]|nr:hypothetical protein [Gammaproteobacteria bacterium]
MNKKTMIACAVALYLFVGLSGFFRFPAAYRYSRTITTYYDPDEGRERTEAIRCRGFPVVFSYCTGTIEAPSDEVPSPPGTPGLSR